MPKKIVKLPRLVYRIGEVAEMLGVSRWTVGRLIESGEIATSRIGALTVVPADEVERLIARHRARAKPVAQAEAESASGGSS